MDDRTHEGISRTERWTWPIPNPLSIVAPVAAVAAAAVLVAPLVAAERFVGGRRDDDGSRAGGTDADIDTAVTNEGPESARSDVEAGAAAEVTPEPTGAATETLDGTDPIALDSRRRSGRDGTKRERSREERSVRERGERTRRRSASEQPELQPTGVGATFALTAEAEFPPALASAPAGERPVDEVRIGDEPARIVRTTASPPDSDIEPASGAATTVADASATDAGPQAEVPQRRLVAPVLDPANQNRRAIDRMRAQKDAAEQVVLNSPDVIAAVAPLVRHVNTVTTHLNEAQVTIGRLTAERDALRQRLIDETGALAEQIDRQMAVEVVDGERRQNRLVRQEGRDAARAEGDATEDEPGKFSLFFQRLGLIIPDDATEDEFKQSARRRQIFAVVVLALLGLGMWLFQQGSSSGTFSRETLALIPYVGTIVQVFLAAWVLYRIVRVGGKGARWLFPQQNTRRRRR